MMPQSQPTIATDHATSVLFKLPLELRRKIYCPVFGDSKMYSGYRSGRTAHPMAWPENTERHQILLTCRMCYNEARQEFYSHTVVVVGQPYYKSRVRVISRPPPKFLPIRGSEREHSLKSRTRRSYQHTGWVRHLVFEMIFKIEKYGLEKRLSQDMPALRTVTTHTLLDLEAFPEKMGAQQSFTRVKDMMLEDDHRDYWGEIESNSEMYYSDRKFQFLSVVTIGRNGPQAPIVSSIVPAVSPD